MNRDANLPKPCSCRYWSGHPDEWRDPDCETHGDLVQLKVSPEGVAVKVKT